MERLQNACNGRSASRNGMNMQEFREHLIMKFPEQERIIQKADTRRELETICKKLMASVSVSEIEMESAARSIKKPVPTKKASGTIPGTKPNKAPSKEKLQRELEALVPDYKELPKMYCEDYTLEELTKKAASKVRLTSKDRIRICTELGLPRWNPIQEESMGYPRARVLEVAQKIEQKQRLSPEDQRLIEQWNANHGPMKERLDTLARRYLQGESLSPAQLKTLDDELFQKYCRCVLKRKTQDAQAFLRGDIAKILEKIPPKDRLKAQAKVRDQVQKMGKNLDQLSSEERARVFSELLPIYLGLAIGGCKKSIYQRTRKLKPRSRKCDDELSQAEIFLQK